MKYHRKRLFSLDPSVGRLPAGRQARGSLPQDDSFSEIPDLERLVGRFAKLFYRLIEEKTHCASLRACSQE